ncbi:uncharacterized protein B0H18DRAFT_1164925 [Fomitopsis serialis]|uniref:uncharacterized protein n=1 Tax=Fomitopsis serialis TaxID=139415 RepID=UPI002008D37D|nr:uncharacterized protein B0H18DRAFT_1164925 [Neoantrodia serialis]KAH9936512.1 hypothetical protein B0H18DRAFT_1164925 [Neoantrodia serialis]
MDNDEPVPTSDPEELEEFKAGSPSYWRGREQLRLRAHTVDADMVALGDLSHALGLCAEYDSSPSPSPQSRPYSPPNINAAPTRSQSNSATSPTPRDRHTPQHMQSSSPASSSLLPTPAIDSDDEDPLIAAGYDTDHIDMQEGAVDAHVASFAVDSIGLSPGRSIKDSLPLIPDAPSPTLSPSADPLSLFSPPPSFPRTPPRRAVQPCASPSASSRVSQSSRHSSPLTPIHSPTRPRSASLSPKPSSPVAGPSTVHLPVGEIPEEQLANIAAEQAQARYSLRTRLARQKNPYAYDKALYKQQMRSNPDAIVKVISPRRRSRHRSRSAARSGDEGSDGDYSGQEDDQDAEDESQRQREGRTRSMSREVASVFDADEGEEERSSRRRPRHRRSPSNQMTAAGPAQQSPRLDNSKDPPQRTRWQPSAFNETFSSDDSAVDDVADKQETNPRRRRARPFPMRRKHISRKSDTPERAATESRSDEHAEPVAKITPNDSSDEHIDEPAPTWRRRKSSASLPLQTPPSSPFPGDASFQDMQWHPLDLDNDFPHHAGSPMPPPSSTPVVVDMSPPHSTRPSEASDSDVMIVSDGHHSSPTRSVDDLDGDSGTNDSFVNEMRSEDRTALSHMWPRVMIDQHFRNVQESRPRRPATPPIRGNSEDREEEQPLRPDATSESDMDRPRQSKRRAGREVRQYASAEGDLGVPEQSSRRNGPTGGAVWEQDPIDRMLTRTRFSDDKKNRTRKSRSRGGAKISSNTLHVVTAGARHASGRQTVLSFERASRSRSASPFEDVPVRQHIQTGDGRSKAKAKRKGKEPRDQGTSFAFAGEGGQIVSGRAHKTPVTIDAEQVATNTASPSRGTKAAAAKERTLQDYWSDDADQLHARVPVEAGSKHNYLRVVSRSTAPYRIWVLVEASEPIATSNEDVSTNWRTHYYRARSSYRMEWIQPSQEELPSCGDAYLDTNDRLVLFGASYKNSFPMKDSWTTLPQRSTLFVTLALDRVELTTDAVRDQSLSMEIFKSRNFANLSDETPELPSFLRHSDISLLFENKLSDTAYTLLLKLVVKAAGDTRPRNDGDHGTVGPSPKVKKLLSLCIPRGSVPFTKGKPPTSQHLSMLYNRFSAVAVAFYLEPSMGNIKHCLLPYGDMSSSRTPITNTGRVRANTRRYSSSYGVQLLLGCARRIIETPVMNPGQTVSEYPDPAWLRGPWVKRIFPSIRNSAPTRSSSTTAGTTIVETAEDSQESQEYFDVEDMNWDDPELVAALDPENSAKGKELKQNDEAVCEIIVQDIAETIYRLVMRHFSGPNESESLEQYSDETDRWVDCWVGCASVLVQNGKRSWEKISDDSWRRRVGLRFMLMVLRLDPSAYFVYQFQFLDVLMQSLVQQRSP